MIRTRNKISKILLVALILSAITLIVPTQSYADSSDLYLRRVAEIQMIGAPNLNVNQPRSIPPQIITPDRPTNIIQQTTIYVEEEPLPLPLEEPLETLIAPSTPQPMVEEIIANYTAPEQITSTDQYKLGAEDKITITVFGEKDLSGDFKIADDGTISMPLIGTVSLQGLTLRDAEEKIKTQLRQGYLKKPDVSIEVLAARPFYIMGEVRRPGSYNYVSGMNVIQAVAISGGFTYRANKKYVEVLRGNPIPNEPIQIDPNAIVKAGDIIFVRERFF